MASSKQCTDKAGNVFYKVTASCGRGRRVTRSWHPEAGWSRKTIERELNKFAATLENSLQSNEVVTRQEQIEIDRQAAIEAARSFASEISDEDEVIVVWVYAGEYKTPSGDVYGDPYAIYSISNKGKEETVEAMTEMGYSNLECDEYIGS